MKVLAFEDSFDIEALLISASVDMSSIEFKQLWNTENWLQEINQFMPEVLLLDHFIPPTKGLEVLQMLNLEAHHSRAQRPEQIIAMSSSSMANQRMLQFGADIGIVKMDLATLDIWPKDTGHPNVTPL